MIKSAGLVLVALLFVNLLLVCLLITVHTV
jgi:hypothetical protein